MCISSVLLRRGDFNTSGLNSPFFPFACTVLLIGREYVFCGSKSGFTQGPETLLWGNRRRKHTLLTRCFSLYVMWSRFKQAWNQCIDIFYYFFFSCMNLLFRRRGLSRPCACVCACVFACVCVWCVCVAALRCSSQHRVCVDTTCVRDSVTLQTMLLERKTARYVQSLHKCSRTDDSF